MSADRSPEKMISDEEMADLTVRFKTKLVMMNEKRAD